MSLPASPESPRSSAAWGPVVGVPEMAAALLAARRTLQATLDPTRRPPPTPLVLFGPPGVGKTLILRTLIDKLAAAPNGHTAQLVAARELSPEDRSELSATDLLGIEDIQFLPDRLSLDLERLLDARTAQRRVTVVTAPLGPAELNNLSRRLTSRLSAGLIVPLEAWSVSSRRTLIAHHALARRVPLTPDALDWLATQPTGGGVRPALGQLERLAVLARGAAEELDARTVERLLADSHPEESMSAGPIDRIVQKVASEFGVSVREILGSSRLRTIVVPRQVVFYLARNLTPLSLPRLGSALGNRDHTTVLHAVRAVDQLMATDPALARRVRTLIRELT